MSDITSNFSAKSKKLIAEFNATKDTFADRNKKADLNKRLKDAEQRAINILKGKAQTTREKEQFKKQFPASAPPLITSNILNDETNRLKDKANDPLPTIQKTKDDAINLITGEFSLSPEDVFIPNILPITSAKSGIDDIVTGLITNITNNAVDFEIQKLVSVMAPFTWTEVDRARLFAIDREITAAVGRSGIQQSLREERRILEQKVKVIGSIEGFVKAETERLKGLLDITEFTEPVKEDMKLKLKDSSRIIENLIARRIEIDNVTLRDLQQMMLSVAKLLQQAAKKETDIINSSDQNQRRTQQDVFEDARNRILGGLEGAGKALTGSGEQLAALFGQAFDSSPEKWAKIFIDQVKGQEMAKKQLSAEAFKF